MDYQKISDWKRKYEDIFQIQVHDIVFIFRSLGREEYKEIILLNLQLGEFQEQICETAVLHPESFSFSNGLAGFAEVLSDCILDVSGLLLNQSTELLNQFREEMSIMDYQVDCIIHEAFPTYSVEEIANWSMRKTMYYFSRAEWILENLKGIRLMFHDSHEKQKDHKNQVDTSTTVNKQPPSSFQSSQDNSKEPDQREAKNEEEVLAMLAEAGGNISSPTTSMNEMMPELNWFKHIDELKGEFD